MRQTWAILLLLGISATTALAAESDVSAKLIADTVAVAPAHPLTLAVVLTPPPGWHIYWKNPGDSGLPTKFRIDAPPGFIVGDAAFPLPQRIALPGNIINYGYERETVFLLPVTPPSTLPAGQSFTFKINASWLCCKDQCVPGHAALTLSLPVATPVPANEQLFAKARAAMPDSVAPPNTTLSTQATPDGLALHIHWKTPPASVELFPFAADGLQISATHVETTGNDSTLTLQAHILSGQTLKTQTLPVLVSFVQNDGSPHGFSTHIDLRALSAHASP